MSIKLTHTIRTLRHLLLLLAACLLPQTADAQTAARKKIVRPVAAVKRPATTAQRSAAAAQKLVDFTISGRVYGISDGDWVMLCEPSDKGLHPVDSAQIDGGRFSFKGKVKSIPYKQYLSVGTGRRAHILDLFVEKGDIKVFLTSESYKDSVGGTRHNDIYTPYRDSINNIYARLQATMVQSMLPSNSATDREAYAAGVEVLRKKIVEMTYGFASKNIGNWVGVYLFGENYKQFTRKQNQALLARLARSHPNLPLEKEIRQFVSRQK